LLGKKFQLRKAFPNLQKFSVFAYYDNVGCLPGPDGTLTKMIRAKDRWFWMIPLSGGETSIGVVMDTTNFKALGMPPEQALQHCLQEQPTIHRWMTDAKRTTPVYATGDFSYRNTRFTGDRWMLAGDAAGFIDPVFSSGVFLALLSGELAADALNKIFDDPNAQPTAFRYYEKRVGRVLDLYLRWASAWYTQEFVEVFLFPKEMFELVPTISAVLSGNEAREFDMRWRLWIFDTLVKLQKRTSKIAPPLALTPQQSHAEPSR
jgi:flavin-dependent dehydrogenase